MKKQKRQNLVAKFARLFQRSTTMRDRTKYNRKSKHKNEEVQ
jgi:hypothetical protein